MQLFFTTIICVEYFKLFRHVRESLSFLMFQILPLIILPNSLLSKETQKVTCIFDSENAKTVAGAALMTAPTTVFSVF